MLYGLPFHLMGSALLIIFFALKYRSDFNFKAFIFLTFSLYIWNLVVYNVFPLPCYGLDLEYVASSALQHNFTPISDIRLWFQTDSTPGALVYIFKRVLLLLPLGLYLPMIFKWVSNLGRALLLGFLSSLTFELIKVIIGLIIGGVYKAASIDLVFLYSIGSFLGSVAFLVSKPWLDEFIDFSGYTYVVRGN